MSLRIIKPGFLSTIQDTGRWGFQSYGVPVSGAMDTAALMEANILVGNDEQTCGLELTLHGAELETTTDVLIAVSGGGSVATVNNESLPFGKPVLVSGGSILKFISSDKGSRSYLAVAGGFDVTRLMNSASTYLPSRFGGFDGRALRSGDEVPINSKKTFISSKIMDSLSLDNRSFKIAPWGIPPGKESVESMVRVFPGPESDWISEEASDKFYRSPFVVMSSSNRMGYRLSGETLHRVHEQELISATVSKGTIQCIPDGSCIILMADSQTTGGYPRIAQIASADLGICAQLRIGDRVYFSCISFAEAEQLLLEKQRRFQELKRGVAIRFGV